jgi:4a-hydroxytetrahydrobiopterin dehydratase
VRGNGARQLWSGRFDAVSWDERDGALTRVFGFAGFVEAFAFMTRVALVAQRLDHHPDMTISWDQVTVRTTSHDAGNTVTDRDRRLVAAIDGVA